MKKDCSTGAVEHGLEILKPKNGFMRFDDPSMRVVGIDFNHETVYLKPVKEKRMATTKKKTKKVTALKQGAKASKRKTVLKPIAKKASK